MIICSVFVLLSHLCGNSVADQLNQHLFSPCKHPDLCLRLAGFLQIEDELIGLRESCTSGNDRNLEVLAVEAVSKGAAWTFSLLTLLSSSISFSC